ncbi:MAG: BolA family protein [Gammaproteobacteria bacterium]
MHPDDVKALINAGLPDCQVQVSGDGSHFEAIVIGELFADMSPVKKQQAVYATVKQHITSGELHALSIKTYTPDEWQKAQKLRVGS